jgi:hypothetical protein
VSGAGSSITSLDQSSSLAGLAGSMALVSSGGLYPPPNGHATNPNSKCCGPVSVPANFGLNKTRPHPIFLENYKNR